MRFAPFAACGLLAVVLLGSTPPSDPARADPARADSGGAPFTPVQREEIGRIVRESLTRDPSILRDAIAALQADEGARRDTASRSAIAAARRMLVADPADPVSGNPRGDVTVVEFFDTRCPYCRRLDPTVASLLQRDHGVRLVYKDLPVLGPASVLGARALLAAQLQGERVPDGYERLREALMRPGGEASKEGVLAEARRVGLDAGRLERDMADPAIQARLHANIRLARSLGIEGTPALVIGQRLIPGAVDLAEIERAVKAAREGG